MAARTIRAVKLVAIGSSAIPLIGFTGSLAAASPEDPKAKKITRACDLPLYDAAINTAGVPAGKDDPEKNALQKQITRFRIQATDIIEKIQDGIETVRDTAKTGADHSKATLDYVQNNPGELPRVVFVSVATMGGFILGYRKNVFKKVLYASIAGLSSAALCYPTFTVDLASAVKEDSISLWRKNIGWPFAEEPKVNPKAPAKLKKMNMSIQDAKPVKELKVDRDQSKKEDKDLYTTRS